MADPQFTRGPARRPVQIGGEPLLQWATGLQTKDRRLYAGWIAERGKHDEFDAAMETAGFTSVVIRHGKGNFVEHWAIETANLFVVAEGVQSIGEMKHTDERYGIAFGWRTLESGRQQSVLKLRAHLRELLELGFDYPLILSVKSTLTGDVIAALIRQYEVLDAIDAFRAQDKKPALNPPFYACSIPIGPGQEVARGSGGQTKEITPPVAKIPTPVTKDHVRAHWIARGWEPFIEGRLDDTIRWSMQLSRSIAEGYEPREQEEQY
jgi:hypothetical protein